jgi:hypothetical protein
MKKTILCLVIAAMTVVAAKAQKDNAAATADPLRVEIGADGALPIGDFSNANNIGFGGFVKGGYAISKNFEANLSVGFTAFPGKTYSGFKLADVHLFNILAGGSYLLDGGFHIDAGVGFALVSGDAGFQYRVGAGYRFAKSWDVTVNYNAVSQGGTISYIGAGIAYAILK